MLRLGTHVFIIIHYIHLFFILVIYFYNIFIYFCISYSKKTIVQNENTTLLFISHEVINEFSLLFGGGRRRTWRNDHRVRTRTVWTFLRPNVIFNYLIYTTDSIFIGLLYDYYYYCSNRLFCLSFAFTVPFGRDLFSRREC